MYAKSGLLDWIFNKMGFKNVVAWSAMLGDYVISDKMAEALELFDKMMADTPSNVRPTSLAFVLGACSRLADLDRGKRIHCYLIKSGFLLDMTIGNSLLSMYSKGGKIDYAMQFF